MISVISVVCVVLGAQAPADGWTQFRGNARLTGIAASAPPAAPAVRWTYEAGEAIDSSPAIADGTVYVATSNGDLVAIDLASGKLRWKYATGGPIGESSPAVGGGLVFFGRPRRHGARGERRRRQPADGPSRPAAR